LAFYDLKKERDMWYRRW